MLIIHGRFEVHPDDMEAWVESAQRMATVSRTEPGCVAYDFSVDVLDPTHAYILQMWSSTEEHDAHTASAHHVTRTEELGHLRVETREIRYYDAEIVRDLLEERGTASS